LDLRALLSFDAVFCVGFGEVGRFAALVIGSSDSRFTFFEAMTVSQDENGLARLTTSTPSLRKSRPWMKNRFS
jgi:hypothetical protein